MNQKELQNSLGKAMEKLTNYLETGKYSEKDIKIIQTMCSTAKQMVNNADIIIRASKIVGDKESCKNLL